MFIYRKLNVRGKQVEAFQLKLFSRNLIVIKGNKGYIMCGYLNMDTAEKLKEVAVRISGVNTISQALKANVEVCSKNAQKLGIYKGQPITEVIEIIG